MNVYKPTHLDKHIDKESNPPHWIWIGAQSKKNKDCWARGYLGRPGSARRAVWEFTHDRALSSNQTIWGDCGVPRCVSPGCSFITGEDDDRLVTAGPRATNRYTKEQLDTARELAKDPHYGLKFIERHTGVGRRTVYNIRRQLNEEVQNDDKE